MLFTIKTWDRFHIISNLKNTTVDTFPVTGLFQTQLFLASISLAIAVEVNVRNITKNGLNLLWQPGQNGRKRFEILAHSEILMIVGGGVDTAGVKHGADVNKWDLWGIFLIFLGGIWELVSFWIGLFQNWSKNSNISAYKSRQITWHQMQCLWW